MLAIKRDPRSLAKKIKSNLNLSQIPGECVRKENQMLYKYWEILFDYIKVKRCF